MGVAAQLMSRDRMPVPAPMPLVGRRAELAVLHGLIDAAGAGAPTAAEIVGDPGIGKTRLLAELAEHAHRRGWMVLRGRATEFGRRVPFGMIGEALEDRLGVADVSGLDGSELRLVRSVFAGLPEPLVVERYRVHRAMRAALEVLARPTGLVLILDDLHWADDGSAELVEYLLRRPPQGRVLTAVAHRPRQTPDRLRDTLLRAVQTGAVKRIEVGPLTTAEADELLPVGDNPDHRRWLYDAAGGNPFYLQALVASPSPGVRPAPMAGMPAAEGDVPEAVRAAMLTELAGLGPRQLLAARACAVAGDGAEPGLIARIAGLDLGDVLMLLDELAARDVVRAAPAGGGFEFRHPLVHRVVYDAAGAGWRAAAHARAAAALGETGAPAVELAHHVQRSAQRGDERAIEVLREAAAAALHRSPAVAAHWLQTALRLLPDGPDSLLAKLGLLTMRARALALTGRLKDSRDTLHALRRLLPTEMAEQQAQITALCATIERLLGRHSEAHAQLLAGLAALPDKQSPAALALKLGLATGVAMRIEPWFNRDWPREALATARHLDDRAALATALALCVVVSHLDGQADEKTGALLDESAAIADALPDGDLAENTAVLVYLGWAELCQERLDDAVRHLHRALPIARTAGQSHLMSLIHATLGVVYTLRGDLRRAARHLDDELDAAFLTGSEALRSFALRNQSWLAFASGDAREALRLSREALACAEKVQYSFSRLADGALAGAYLLAGDPATCVDLITAVSDNPDLWVADPVERSSWYEIVAAAQAALGRTKEAAGWADRAFSHAGGLPRRTGLAYLARAHALLPEDCEGAAIAAVSAVNLLRTAGDRMAAGRAHVLAGSALAADADLDSARRHFAEAIALFQACEAPRQVEYAMREQRRMNARQPRRSRAAPGRTPADSLTTRERQVAELAARGLTNHEIGEALHISPKTVNIHLGRIFAKLGVPRRAALAGRLATLVDE